MAKVWFRRPTDPRAWVRFAYVDDMGNTYSAGVLSRNFSPQQINAAMNTTIIIERMLRMGRSRIRP